MCDAAGVGPRLVHPRGRSCCGCAATCPAAHGPYTAVVSSGNEAPWELGTDGPMSILVGVDGSTTSTRAGWYAAGLARRQQARVTAVYVAPVSAGLAVTGAAAGLVAARREADEQITEDMRRRAGEFSQEFGVPIASAPSGVTPSLSCAGSPTRSAPTPSW